MRLSASPARALFPAIGLPQAPPFGGRLHPVRAAPKYRRGRAGKRPHASATTVATRLRQSWQKPCDSCRIGHATPVAKTVRLLLQWSCDGRGNHGSLSAGSATGHPNRMKTAPKWRRLRKPDGQEKGTDRAPKIPRGPPRQPLPLRLTPGRRPEILYFFFRNSPARIRLNDCGVIYR